MKNLGFVALIFFLLVTGCASIKENSKETNPTLPLAFEGIDSLRTSIGLLKWEEYFQDENLKSLIRHGLVHNQDNRIWRLYDGWGRKLGYQPFRNHSG